MENEEPKVTSSPSLDVTLDEVIDAYDDLGIKHRELENQYDELMQACEGFNLAINEKEKENEILKEKIKELENEVSKLKENETKLLDGMSKLTKGKENQDKVMGLEKVKNDERGIGYESGETLKNHKSSELMKRKRRKKIRRKK